ncbi:protocadherin gamma-B7-like [Watersipora subatra]|uniref:protocadherin gamma-B7-like n=1 Tax=Watersipora subatra TaxID=2589382 RepID=UPI00355B6FFA
MFLIVAVLLVRQFLNYEKVSEYNLTVIAYDLGRPRRTSQLLIQVDVEDVADSIPVFQQPLYELFLTDNVTVGTVIIEITAGYGDYLYTIEESKFFSINSSSGDISVSQPLQGGSEHQLSVRATDFYEPPTIAYTLVKVVVDESDPRPRFAKETYAGFVDENSPPPVEIIDLTSSDEQRGRAVRYKIVEGNEDGLFYLDQFTGKLFSNVTFDREERVLYSLKIQAFREEYRERRDMSNCPRHQRDAEYLLSKLSADIFEQVTGLKQEDVISELMHVIPNIALDSANSGYNFTHKLRMAREVTRQLDVTTIQVTIRDENDNPPRFDTAGHIGIPDNAAQGDTVAYIRASDPDEGDNSTLAFGLIQPSAYFKIISDSGAVVLLASTITLSQYDLLVEAVDRNGHSTGQRSSKRFKLLVTRNESRVSYEASIPYKDLPAVLHLAGNLSKILGIDVRVEQTQPVSETISTITMFAFADKNTMMDRRDLLGVLNANQAQLNSYFGNLSDIITVTAKPIISSGGGGATDIAFIVMGLVIGAAAIFGILLLTIYWKQRVIAEKKGDQGNLIEDNGEDDAQESDKDQPLTPAETLPNNQMYNQMAFPGMMFPSDAKWMNPYQMQIMSQAQNYNKTQ